MTSTTDPAGSERRRDELAANLAAVTERLEDARRQAGRVEAEPVSLTVVTKFFPASDVRLLAGLGVRDVGENRHQEAMSKSEGCADLSLRWHFIGSLQSNKAAAVTRYATLVESVDRTKLLPGLARGAENRGAPLDCLLQLSLDDGKAAAGRGGSSDRGGVLPSDLGELAEATAVSPWLRLRGVMAVAPLGEDPRPAFERLARLAEVVRSIEPSATWISAGMSGDLEAAVEHGATHVRIGSAVLGERPRGR